MSRFLKYLFVFFIGFFVAKIWYNNDAKKNRKEQINVIVNSVKNLRKLVVSKGSYSEVYNYSDSKKYFYDYLSFDKKAILTINADVEVGYDLSKLEIQIDSIKKQIIINKIPKEEVVIIPSIKYFDLQQSQFNTFSKEELNKINQKSVDKIKETIKVTNLKDKAQKRLFAELSKIYQLSSIYNWEVVNNTHYIFNQDFKKVKP